MIEPRSYKTQDIHAIKYFLASPVDFHEKT